MLVPIISMWALQAFSNNSYQYMVFPSWRHSMDQKYRNLWAAVLKQAIKDAQYSLNNSLSSPGLWFCSDSHSVGSFLWICGVLNIDPESVRPVARFEMKHAA